MNIEKINGAGFLLLSYDLKEQDWKLLTLVALDGSYDLPKGVIDKGESVLDAAKRELFEETNIDINSNHIIKTWVDWDYEWEKYKEDSINETAVLSEENNLAMFFCEVKEEILKEIKLLPNPYTNIVEHLNYKLINILEFESERTPEYMRNLFKRALYKIQYFGEKRGFNESNKKEKRSIEIRRID